MKIVIAWLSITDHWHIGTLIYGPLEERNHHHNEIRAWADTGGKWEGRRDGFLWTLRNDDYVIVADESQHLPHYGDTTP